jgi:hypothetical protein
MTQVDYTAVTAIVDRRKNTTAMAICVCVDNDMKTNLIPFLLWVKNKPHDEVKIMFLFLSLVWRQTGTNRAILMIIW